MSAADSAAAIGFNANQIPMKSAVLPIRAGPSGSTNRHVNLISVYGSVLCFHHHAFFASTTTVRL